MTFLILEEPANSKHNDTYMGTYRKSPEYCSALSESEPVNKLWEWYLHKEHGSGGVNLTDLERAHELIAEYRKQGLVFNIIEIADHQEQLHAGEFIGYDLSYQNHDSVLSWGLTLSSESPVTKLVEYYFSPKLNRYGLLDDYNDVSFLFDVLKAVNQYEPGGFEPHLDEFKIIAIGMVVVPDLENQQTG